MLPLIYAAGVCQAVFLIVALGALKVRNRYALTVLQMLVAVFSILLAENLQVELRVGESVGIGLAIEFAMGPLIYLFVRAIHRDERRFPVAAAWHFAPLAIASVVLIWLNVGVPGRVSLSNSAMHDIIAAIVLIKIGYFFAYAAAALRERAPVNASASRRHALTGLRRILIVVIATYAFTAASFIAFLVGASFAPDSDVIGGIVLAASLYAIGYFSLVNRDIFDLRDPYGAPMPSEEATALRAKLVGYLNRDDAFRDPGLTLSRAAKAIGAKPAQLSQALNSDGEGGFNRTLNQRRLTAYLAARAEPANAEHSVLDLALACGFNSKATFYRVLREGQQSNVLKTTTLAVSTK